MTITFTTISDAAIVNAIEVVSTAAPTDPSVRVNVGGSGYTDGTSQNWVADSSYSGGSLFSTGATISGTSDQALFQSGRYGNFSYYLALPNGSYQVVLKFAEPNRNSAGRVFNVTAQGTTVLSNFDVWATGGYQTATDQTFTTTVSDGQLVLTFTTVSDAAIVNAIQVGPSGGATPTPTSTGPTATPSATATPTATATSVNPAGPRADYRLQTARRAR